MGIPDTSLLEKVKSWIAWGGSDLSPPSSESAVFKMHSSSVRICSECNTSSDELFNGYHCHSCGRWVCHKCIKELVSHLAVESSGAVQNVDCEEPIKFCKFCGVLKISEKVHPANSPRESPEPPSPSFSGESIQDDRLARYLESRDCGYSPLSVTCNNMTAIVPHPCLASVRCSRSRGGDEEQADDSDKHFHSPSNEYASDVDSSSMSSRLEFCSFKSVGSSPFDSPSSGTDFTSYSRLGHAAQQGQEDSPLSLRDGPLDQENMAVLRRPDTGAADPDNMDDCSDDLSASRNQYEKSRKPWDFESNGLIWSPPLPVDENDDAETNFFSYDDDDDYFAGDSVTFSASSSLSRNFSAKERDTDGDKEPLKFVIQGHFRALVSQLLQGEGIQVSGVDSSENWLDIVASLAWQAANFVKPDTRRGGSMDPVDYVKVKCIASGIPIDSSLIKGVVCTKNIKHKRMTTQYKNPRLLLLGGALEYRSVTNQLASFNTLVQEENDHLKMIISKIEALRPNVLLVEKNVSPYAQEYLLTKEISLVPNVKKPLMERIARCTGALISPSIDTISTTRLGNCELFRVERFLEEHELANQFNKKPTKTLMFFEGCPRRLGCTVLLRGSCCDELKKVKDVVQYAVFAAYHLSLETSFLADEGASLPKMKIEQTVTMPADEGMPVVPLNSFEAIADYSSHDNGYTGSELVSENIDDCGTAQSLVPVNNSFGDILPDICHMPLSSSVLNHFAVCDCNELKTSRVPTLEASSLSKSELLDIIAHQQSQVGETLELEKSDRPDGHSVSNEYFLASDTYQSILVSFSSRCVPKGTVCERSRLLRIKFYGSFDKPLGRYLRDDLFDQTSFCRNCKEPAEAHVLCYTHQQGNLTINVRSLSSMKLPGEQDGKIWMWHRCLRCAHVDGVPPSTRRVIMSDAAWGLSFGKFLELSFSNHATADRVAPCGHSLQKDCLRFYGFGSMVGFFRYSPIDILNVHLPPSVLEFTGIRQQEWIRKEAAELLSKVEVFYSEISNVLDGLEERSKSYGSQLSEATELQNHILELKVQLMKERNNYSETLKLAVMESLPPGQEGVDILDLNRTRRSLIIDSRVWDRQIYSLDSLLKTSVPINPKQKVARQNILMAGSHDSSCQEPLGSAGNYLQFEQGVISHLVDQSHREDLVVSSCHVHKQEDAHLDSETSSIKAITEDIACDASNLSDRIDSAWTGTDQRVIKVQELDSSDTSGQIRVATNSPLKRMMGPVRVNSFDSALRVQERIQKGMPLSNLRSFHASGDYRTMLRDPVSNTLRTSSQAFPLEVQKSNILLTTIPSFISSASDMMGGARLLLPHRTHSDVVIGVYDDDPASIVSYALNLKEHEDWVAANKSNDIEGKCNIGFVGREDSAASTISGWQSYGSMDLDYMNFGSDGMSSSISNLFTDSKKSPHFGISYNDASGVGGKVKYSVTCYFANQFHSLRKKCCPGDVDFVRSLSRCQKWSAQGGKSNVYFAKSLDERFIIKQVKKTELESFEEFAPEYFKYVTESLNSRSPTCLAKILGIYQVAVKHLKSGRETKMDLMVMENLFFRRTISRVYDLKGSARSRYNPDSSGVLLDMNLVEELRTEPIFLGSKAKRSLERAIWNDTSFLASVDVMDYSLLVGVDEEKKELVLGIIDFMRQYTWDKHLETWVKASGILGGPKNASPTIISPVQYKKRFRKAMTSYFLTVPDQWSTS